MRAITLHINIIRWVQLTGASYVKAVINTTGASGRYLIVHLFTKSHARTHTHTVSRALVHIAHARDAHTIMCSRILLLTDLAGLQACRNCKCQVGTRIIVINYADACV